jgi:hypothetical protein
VGAGNRSTAFVYSGVRVMSTLNVGGLTKYYGAERAADFETQN